MGNVQTPKPPNGRERPVKGNGAIEMDPRQLLRALTALGRGDFTVPPVSSGELTIPEMPTRKSREATGGTSVAQTFPGRRPSAKNRVTTAVARARMPRTKKVRIHQGRVLKV